MIRPAACWVAVALCGVACLGPRGPRLPRDALEGWHAIETGDVRMIAEAPGRDAEALAADLAGFDAAFAYLLGRKIESQTKTAIHLIRGPELATRFGLGHGVAGWAFGTSEGSFACVQITSKAETRITLFHEYTHLLLARWRQSAIRRWYTEGLADYFSTLMMRDGAVVVGDVPYERLAWFGSHKPMPLAQLFGDKAGTDAQHITGFYATSWALTHYLLGTPRGRGELSRFEKELSRGVPLDEARERAFARPFEALDGELATHIDYLKRGVPTGIVLDPSRIAVARPPAAVALQPFEVARAIGSLASS